MVSELSRRPGMISAEEMIDKGRDSNSLTQKVHNTGGSIGRTELDESE